MDNYTKYTFFYKTSSPFSNWHPCKFTVMEGRYCYHPPEPMEFSSTEQYFMYMKAMTFRDIETAKLIMSTHQPREQKQLGRQVKPFNKPYWYDVSCRIMYRGCFHKFIQNDKLKKKLLATAGTLLCEASPTDTLWGCGLVADDPLIQDKKNWRGTNWLGQILTMVREDIINGVTQTY